MSEQPETKSSKKASKSAQKPQLRVTLLGSAIGCSPKQRANLRGLGLMKRHQTRSLEDTDAVRGMIAKVSHLVRIEA